MNATINPFAETVKEYTDKRLLDIINYPNDYSPKLVEASKFEASSRGVHKMDNEVKQQDTTSLLATVRNKITQGESIESCEQYLLNAGLDQDEALSILDKAARTAALKEKRKVEKDNDGPGFWSVLFIILITIKIIYQLAR